MIDESLFFEKLKTRKVNLLKVQLETWKTL